MRNIPLTNRLLRADFDTVMEKYHFYDRMVSFNKNFEFEPPLDTITCIIAINDDEDSYCASYRAIFDYDMNIIDDVLSRWLWHQPDKFQFARERYGERMRILYELSWLWETLVIVLAAAAVCVVCAMLICKAVKKNLSKKTAAVIGAAAFAGAVLAVIVIARTPMPLWLNGTLDCLCISTNSNF